MTEEQKAPQRYVATVSVVTPNVQGAGPSRTIKPGETIPAHIPAAVISEWLKAEAIRPIGTEAPAKPAAQAPAGTADVSGEHSEVPLTPPDPALEAKLDELAEQQGEGVTVNAETGEVTGQDDDGDAIDDDVLDEIGPEDL